MGMRTPLSTVRGLGSAGSGPAHFWMQRVTAVANIPLAILLLAVILANLGADHASVAASLGSPLVAIGLLLLIVSGIHHMRLGMQVIIEDYVHGELVKVLALMANTFFAIALGLACVFAVLKLSFGV